MHAPSIRGVGVLRVVAALGLSAHVVFGGTPAHAAPFECNATPYFTEQLTSAGASTYLYTLEKVEPGNPTSNWAWKPVWSTNAGRLSTTVFNGLGFNPVDGYLYALRRPLDSNPTSPQMDGQRGIFRIGTTGTVQMANVSAAGNNAYIRITGLPTAMKTNSGTFDAVGNYFITGQNIGPIYRIRNLAGVPDHSASDAATISPVVAADTIPVQAADASDALPSGYTGIGAGVLGDMAVNPAESTPDLTVMYGLYGAVSGVVYIYRLALEDPSGSNPVARLSRRATDLPADAGLYGSVYLDSDGLMHVYRHGAATGASATAGALYRMDPRAPGTGPVAATQLGGDGPRANNTDAASCAYRWQLDVVKQAGSVQALDPIGRRFRVPYTIKLGNTGNTWFKAQVSENLRATFSTGNPTLSIASAPTVSAGDTCMANPAFNGGAGAGPADHRLLDGQVDLLAGASCTISFSVDVEYPDLASVPSGVQNNTAWASGTGGSTANPGHRWDNGPTQPPTAPDHALAVDESDHSTDLPSPPGSDNANPQPTPVTFPQAAIDVVKAAGTVVSRAPNQFEVPYTIVVGNTGALPLPQVQVSENLQQTFPTASSIATSGLAAVPTATCTVNAGFTGQGNLLSGNDSLLPGQSCTIQFTAIVGYPDATSVPTAPQNNTVSASATSPDGVLSADDSTAGGALPPLPHGDAPTPTPVSLTSGVMLQPNLSLTQSVAPGAVFQPGSTGRFSYSVANQGAGPTSGAITVLAQLPAGLSFAATGTVTVNGWTCTITDPTHASCTSTNPLAAGGASAFELDVLVDPGVAVGSTLAAQSKVYGGGDTGKPDANAGGVAIGACADDASTVTGCGFEAVAVAAVSPAGSGVTPVPTLQQWALTLMALLMLAAGVRRLPRRGLEGK